ncbi:MAG: isocitrate dehydrogenase (NADP(+)) [Spirochaetes bacterium]|nr:isocitrate dehydrogenase (NADP(+)) [Spirochaetota bacterium]
MKVKEPQKGEIVNFKKGEMNVPDKVIIPYIEGDGIGTDIMKATLPVVNTAVQKAFRGKKEIIFFEIYAGEKALAKYGNVMPEETLVLINKYKLSLKGPLTTPVGEGYRSLNVFLRQYFNLYACVRPVKYYPGVPSPVKTPEKMDVVIFRENTEDVYAGIEWEEGSKEARKMIDFLENNFKIKVRRDSGLGLKPISETGTKRLVRAAIKYAIKNNRKNVTLVHKGNIMKFTEGAFRNWGYELAKDEFPKSVITEEAVLKKHNHHIPKGKIVIKDRIADSMFQQVLTRADEYDVIALPNLNGDYLSDACAAQVGGLGMAPGANIGDEIAIFEATHGTAPKYAGQNKVNPSSLILSAKLMLDYLGWDQASQLVEKGIARAIQQKRVTYDLARLMGAVTPVKTSEFAEIICDNMGQ